MNKQPKKLSIKISTLFHISIGIALTLLVQNTLQLKENIIPEQPIDAMENEYLQGYYDN